MPVTPTGALAHGGIGGGIGGDGAERFLRSRIALEHDGVDDRDLDERRRLVRQLFQQARRDGAAILDSRERFDCGQAHIDVGIGSQGLEQDVEEIYAGYADGWIVTLERFRAKAEEIAA